MDRLASSYEFLVQLRFALEGGMSVRGAIEKVMMDVEHESDFHREVRHWLTLHTQGQAQMGLRVTKNFYRQALLHVLEQGLRGGSIYSTMQELESEWEKTLHDDIERHLQKLPVLVLMPLVLLQFPAFLILLLGPILADVLERFPT